MYPRGSNADRNLSVYLAVADNATLPQGWGRRAKFSLKVHNQKKSPIVKGARSYSRRDLRLYLTDLLPRTDANHYFTSREADWGWRDFVPLSEMRDPESGFRTDDKVMISASVVADLGDEASSDGALRFPARCCRSSPLQRRQPTDISASDCDGVTRT